jgi:hypothetical protein
MSGRRLLLLSPLVSQVLLGLLVAAGPLWITLVVNVVDSPRTDSHRLMQRKPT